MALTNCTINSASATATSGVADIDTQELYIVPDEGYTVSAIDFLVDDISYADNLNSLIWTDGVNLVSFPNTTVAGDIIDNIIFSNTT